MRPEQYLVQLLSESEQHHSPCGNGHLVWQQWSSEGGDRPLILIHGGYGSWTHWVANIPELRRTHTVWTVDLPGLGASADMPEPHTASHSAKLILQGINQVIGAGREFDLAGFSFGAIVAARLAVQAGSRCKHLVVCGAAGFGDLHVQVDLLRPPAPDVPAAKARAIHSANLRNLMFASNESIDELALNVHGENLSRSRLNTRRLSRTDELVRTLPSIKARLTGIWGSRDATAGGRTIIEKRRQLIQQAQPEAAVLILSGIGHWAMYEDAKNFNQLLLAQL